MPTHKLPNSPPVFVLGVHRSGTSLLTRMLECLGIFVGKDLQADHESLAFISLNNIYLNHTGSSWDKPKYPGEPELAGNIIRQAFAANRADFFKYFGIPEEHWALKDPRLVITLPLWRAIYPQSPVIIIRRNPVAIAKSLFERHHHHLKNGVFPSDEEFYKGKIKFTQRCATMDGALSFAIEQSHVLDRLARSAYCPHRLEISYEGLCHDPALEVWNIARFLGLEPTSEQITKAVALPRADGDQQEQRKASAMELFRYTRARPEQLAPTANHQSVLAQHSRKESSQKNTGAAPHDFLVIGAQKAGTTSLHNYLDLHPQIALPSRKELHFFDDEDLWKDDCPDYDRYNVLFETDPNKLRRIHERAVEHAGVKGEITPVYMYWKPCATRIRQYNPAIKLIAILRNPIYRAISHYRMEFGRGWETLDFWSALNMERERLEKEPGGQHRVYSYMDRGFYVRQLESFQQHFPKHQLMVITSEDLEHRRIETLNRICDFLGVEPWYTAAKHSGLRNYHVASSDFEPNRKTMDFLKAAFRQEILDLSEHLERDLTHWLET